MNNNIKHRILRHSAGHHVNINFAVGSGNKTTPEIVAEHYRKKRAKNFQRFKLSHAGTRFVTACVASSMAIATAHMVLNHVEHNLEESYFADRPTVVYRVENGDAVSRSIKPFVKSFASPLEQYDADNGDPQTPVSTPRLFTIDSLSDTSFDISDIMIPASEQPIIPMKDPWIEAIDIDEISEIYPIHIIIPSDARGTIEIMADGIGEQLQVVEVPAAAPMEIASPPAPEPTPVVVASAPTPAPAPAAVTPSSDAPTQGGLLDIDNPDPDYEGKAVELTATDRDILEHLVMGEAGTQGFEGAALVAQCIRDKYITGKYKSIDDLRVKLQYAGKLTVDPNRDVLDAVKYIFDDGGYAVKHRIGYFYAYKICTSKWHESQNFIIQYKGHRFFDEWN